MAMQGAFAQVHKCQGDDGRITYSSEPCASLPQQRSLGEVRTPAPRAPAASATPEEVALQAQAPHLVPYCRSLQDESGRIRREIANLERPISARSADSEERRTLEVERRRIEVRKLQLKLDDVKKDADGRRCTALGVPLEGSAARSDVARRQCLSLYSALELARYRQGKGYADAPELIAEATENLKRERCSLNAADYPRIALPVR